MSRRLRCITLLINVTLSSSACVIRVLKRSLTFIWSRWVTVLPTYSFLDATGVPKKSWLPVVEQMTVSTFEAGKPKPQIITVSTHPLVYQYRHNVIYVHAKRKAAYTYMGEVLNPCEKPSMANGWVLHTWTEPGYIHQWSLCYRADCIISVLWKWKHDAGLYGNRLMYCFWNQWFLILLTNDF